MKSVELRRKAYDRLLEWKKESNGETAILVNGARRVGKSYLVKKFAETEYKTHVIIDFMKVSQRIKDSFIEDANNLDLLFNKIMLEYGVELHKRESVIVFDEVELFPRARELIKVFVEDGRYDFIETGSLLSIKSNKEKILIPSEEKELLLHPLDFEEYLWAKGDTITGDLLRKFLKDLTPLGLGAHKRLMDLFREYMLIGGMPQVVSTFVTIRDFRKIDGLKSDILSLYREDCSKLAGGYRMDVEKMFDNIPSELNKKDKEFLEKSLLVKSGQRGFEESFMWLMDSRVVNVCFNSSDPSVGLSMYKDQSSLKLYMADTGLLVTHTISELSMDPDAVYGDLLMDRLNLNEGMFVENMIAQMFTAGGHRLYFYSRKDNRSRLNSLKIDFLIMKDGQICPIEVKSSKNTKHVSLDKFREKFGKRLGQSYILCTKDIEVRDGIVYLPLYMAAFM